MQTAAAIIRKQIQYQAYATNNYPPSDDFMIRAEEMLPSTLSAFMEALVPKKRIVKEVVVRKTVAISHAIISTVRSRSFIFLILPIIGYWLLELVIIYKANSLQRTE